MTLLLVCRAQGILDRPKAQNMIANPRNEASAGILSPSVVLAINILQGPYHAFGLIVWRIDGTFNLELDVMQHGEGEVACETLVPGIQGHAPDVDDDTEPDVEFIEVLEA